MRWQSQFRRTSAVTGRLQNVTDEMSPCCVARARRRPAWLFPAITLTLITAIQEAVVRLLFPIPPVKGFNRISYQMTAQAHPKFRMMMDRGLVYDRLFVESRPDHFSETHELNIYGFRGPDFAIDPAAGRRRILLVGDSVTEGIGAPEAGTIGAQLERLLVRDGERAEVINLGVIAATLNHATILARDATTLLRPTDIVLIVYANDLPAPANVKGVCAPAREFPHRDDAWWMPRVATLVKRYIHDEPIYRRWPHAAIRFFSPVPSVVNPWAESTGPPDNLDPALYDNMRAGRLNPWLYAQSQDIPGLLRHDFRKDGSPEQHLKCLAAVCQAVGTRLTVAYVAFCGVVSPRYSPSLVKLGMDSRIADALVDDPIYRRQNRVLAEVCGHLNLPLADATDDLIAAEAAGTPQYWQFDTHPRPAGYATIARTIHRVVRKGAR
jgi:lysophospholipase L1-like esterase